jgi:hypothetical protein
MSKEDCEKQQVYQVIGSSGVEIFSTPNSTSASLQKIAAGLLVRRLNYLIYDDLTPSTGIKFFYVAVSNDLVGYVPAYFVNISGVKTVVLLGQTIQAAIAEPKLKELLKKQHKDCKKKCDKSK